MESPGGGRARSAVRRLLEAIAAAALLFLLAGNATCAAAPGDVIGASPLAAPAGSRAWRVRYASTGLHGEAIEVSGVVIAPATPGRNRPVVSWAHPTTGVAEACAPSALPTVFAKIPQLAALIGRGYVVAATDYPGLGTPGVHPYLVGESEARAAIDAVRAARGLAAAGAGRRYVAWGHSQGGHAALFVGSIAARYAPELTLAGVAAISPPTQLPAILRDDITASTGRILTAYTVWSWSHVYGIPLSSALRSSSAVPVVDAMARTCAQTKKEAYRLGFDAAWTTRRLIKPSIYATPPWSTLLLANSPAPGAVPYFIAQGSADTIVPPEQTRLFVAKACAAGARVVYDVLAGEGHMQAAFVSAPQAIAWIDARFAAKPVPSTCPA